jgi:hypothetical protein
MGERGISAAEVELTIIHGERQSARLGRISAERVFAFEAVWNGRYYDKKRVRVIFEEHDDMVTVVTVISFFF